MKTKAIVLVIFCIIILALLMIGTYQFEKLTARNQEYYEIITELNELGKQAEDMLREAEVKIKAYEDILGDKIRVEIKPMPKREY